ncbi:MAG: hypothetical protein J0L94_16590 [Rhodothermia bacterium]|nr:hypothetical protein [Rhodothermia bacterium]
MKVLIVSRTVVESRRCIGALVRTTTGYRSLRLMDARILPTGSFWPESTPFRIGELWEIEQEPAASLRQPHNEDVLVNDFILVNTSFVAPEKLEEWLRLHLHKIDPPCIWEGPPSHIFDGFLESTRKYNGRGYATKTLLPKISTGFWIPDKPLNKVLYEGKASFLYDNGRQQVPIGKLKYIGEPDPPEQIPAGTLLRVSLSRWIQLPPYPEACWLMLSGWYGAL